jgi:hypothetical protein
VVAGDEDRFKQGRNGNNLMTLFQCNNCHFVNIQHCVLSLTNNKDRYLMKLIRQVSKLGCILGKGTINGGSKCGTGKKDGKCWRRDWI